MRWLLLGLAVLVFVGCGVEGSGRRPKRKVRRSSRKAALKRRAELLEKARNLLNEGELYYAKMCDSDGYKKSAFYRKANSRATEALRILHQLCAEFPDDEEIQNVTRRAQRLKEAIFKDSPMN